MRFEYSYQQSSAVDLASDATGLSFSPDLRRKPTFLRGELTDPLTFREAISALHHVVVSDLRLKPKDRDEYKAWLKQREEADLEAIAAERSQVQQEIARVREELTGLRENRRRRFAPFYQARQRYFDYLYAKDRDAWFVLDPVITVHPDEVSFECFSQDESSYGRLAVGYEHFRNLGEQSPGTTNVDYSTALYDGFQKLRTYKTTRLDIDPSGFDVATTFEGSHKEVKIDLPDSWVRGFLQVSSAMTFPATRIRLHPFDVHNICFVLRRHRELKGPRSLRFQLVPGQPVRVVVEPWNFTITCPRSGYSGKDELEVRVWGRRRLHILERLIPITRHFDVLLLGTGMPSFWLADLGSASFTLGLSGWTSNDWSSAGNFDLLAPRKQVDDFTSRRVFEALRGHWFAKPEDLGRELSLDPAVVQGALAAYTQAGRVMYDLSKGVFRARELSREPLPLNALRFRSEQEEAAAVVVERGGVSFEGVDQGEQHFQLRSVVDDHDVVLALDRDERLVDGSCTCWFFGQNRLRRGPCEHMLATRIMWERKRRKEVLAAS